MLGGDIAVGCVKMPLNFRLECVSDECCIHVAEYAVTLNWLLIHKGVATNSSNFRYENCYFPTDGSGVWNGGEKDWRHRTGPL